MGRGRTCEDPGGLREVGHWIGVSEGVGKEHSRADMEGAQIGGGAVTEVGLWVCGGTRAIIHSHHQAFQLPSMR